MRRLGLAAVVLALALWGLYGLLRPDPPRLHRRSSHPASCLANIGCIGKALRLYAQDYDGHFPRGTVWPGPRRGHMTSVFRFIFPPLGIGWAGQVYPYVRDADAFCCPQDPTPAYEPAVTVSYGLNEAEAGATSEPMAYHDQPGASKLVLLFEVSGATAEVRLPDEGASRGATTFSPVGSADFGVRTTTGKGGARARFAIGDVFGMGGWASAPGLPRHMLRANYCMVDGHAKSLYAADVSMANGRLPWEPGPRRPEPAREAYFWDRGSFRMEAKGRAKALIARGDAMMSKRRFDDAQKQFRAAIRMDRSEARVYARLAEAYERAGNRTAEQAYIRQMLDRPGRVSDCSVITLMNMQYAILLAHDHRWAEAARRYRAGMAAAAGPVDNVGAAPELPSSASRLDHETFVASAELCLGTYGLAQHLLTRESRLQHIEAALKLKPDWDLARRWYNTLLAGASKPAYGGLVPPDCGDCAESTRTAGHRPEAPLYHS